MAGPDKPERIYLDSSVWIAWFDSSHDVEGPVRRVLEWAEAKQLRLLVSPLLLVEALGARPGSLESAVIPQQVERVLTGPSVVVVEFDLTVALKARQLRLAGTVKPAADAIHLAHAISAGADVLFTMDKDDFPLGTTVEGVYVSKPYLLGDPDLFNP